MRVELVRPGNGEGGFALVAVLSVMALLSGMLLGLSLWSRNSVENAAVAAAGFRSERLVRSAAAVAAYQLFVLKLPRERVDNQQLTLDDGTVTLAVSDDGGKVDLNRSEALLLAAAYRAAGLSRMSPDMFAARVKDWRDEDEAASENGAEAPAYRNAGLPPPRNREFRTVSDLRWVLGVDQADVAALAPFVTVFNPDGRVNPYSAPLSLIRSLPNADPTSAAGIEALVGAPRSEQNLGRMSSLLADQPLLGVEPATVIRLRVKAVTYGKRQAQTSELMAIYSDKTGPLVGYLDRK